ncbi:hypothetical protein BGZ60DRAFT_526560 [Tricladium varicosporioides]|nr:hypothetical protein BGZ60DRAFT_526560 [Hymenoscyphus varicosporioides]
MCNYYLIRHLSCQHVESNILSRCLHANGHPNSPQYPPTGFFGNLGRKKVCKKTIEKETSIPGVCGVCKKEASRKNLEDIEGRTRVRAQTEQIGMRKILVGGNEIESPKRTNVPNLIWIRHTETERSPGPSRPPAPPLSRRPSTLNRVEGVHGYRCSICLDEGYRPTEKGCEKYNGCCCMLGLIEWTNVYSQTMLQKPWNQTPSLAGDDTAPSHPQVSRGRIYKNLRNQRGKSESPMRISGSKKSFSSLSRDSSKREISWPIEHDQEPLSAGSSVTHASQTVPCEALFSTSPWKFTCSDCSRIRRTTSERQRKKHQGCCCTNGLIEFRNLHGQVIARLPEEHRSRESSGRREKTPGDARSGYISRAEASSAARGYGCDANPRNKMAPPEQRTIEDFQVPGTTAKDLAPPCPTIATALCSHRSQGSTESTRIPSRSSSWHSTAAHQGNTRAPPPVPTNRSEPRLGMLIEPSTIRRPIGSGLDKPLPAMPGSREHANTCPSPQSPVAESGIQQPDFDGASYQELGLDEKRWRGYERRGHGMYPPGVPTPLTIQPRQVMAIDEVRGYSQEGSFSDEILTNLFRCAPDSQRPALVLKGIARHTEIRTAPLGAAKHAEIEQVSPLMPQEIITPPIPLKLPGRRTGISARDRFSNFSKFDTSIWGPVVSHRSSSRWQEHFLTPVVGRQDSSFTSEWNEIYGIRKTLSEDNNQSPVSAGMSATQLVPLDLSNPQPTLAASPFAVEDLSQQHDAQRRRSQHQGLIGPHATR